VVVEHVEDVGAAARTGCRPALADLDERGEDVVLDELELRVRAAGGAEEGAAAKEMVESFSAKLRDDFQQFGMDLDNIQEHLVGGVDVREGFEVFDLVVHAFTDDDGAATRAERHAQDHADEMDVFCNKFAVLPGTEPSALFDGDMQQAFKAFGVALRARISQLPATCLTWPDPADDDADDLIPDFPPGGGDDEIHVFHHMSSIELENYEA